MLTITLFFDIIEVKSEVFNSNKTVSSTKYSERASSNYYNNYK